MFKSSAILKFYQTSRHLLKVIPEAIMSSDVQPTGLIASKGIELLSTRETFTF